MLGFGNIFTPADDDSDISSATSISEFQVVGVPPSEVPLPAAARIFITGLRRKRRAEA